MNFERGLKFPGFYINKHRLSIFDAGEPMSNRTRTRMAVSAFFFCQGLCFASWASRIPDIKAALHLSEATLGTLLLALPLGQLSAMPFSGRLIARFGSRKVLRIGLILYSIALTNLGFASSAWELGLALYIYGICGNLCNLSVNTQAIGVERLFGRSIMASFHGVWSVAGFTGALLGLFIMSLNLSPYSHFWIVAFLGFGVALIASRYLIYGTSPAPAEKKPFFSKPDALLVQLGVIGFCCMASEGTMFDWSGIYFRNIVKAPAGLVTLGYASFMIMMAAGRFFGDRLTTRIGQKKMLQLSGVMISAGLFISVLFPNIMAATLGFLIVGFGVSSVVPMVYSIAGKASSLPPSMALASVSSISYLGFLMGPPLIGYIAEATDLRFSFATIGLLGFFITFMVSKLKIVGS